MDDEDFLKDIGVDEDYVPWDEDWSESIGDALDEPWYSDVWKYVNNNAGSLLSLISGGYGMYQGNKMQGLAKEAFARSDPFGAHREQYAQQLQGLMQNPSSFLEDPTYKAALDQGQQAVERRMASQGYLGSGNMAAELQSHAMGFANDYLNQRISQLSGLAGAGMGPNYGAALSGYASGADLTSQGLGSIGYGVGGLIGGGASAGTEAFSSAGGEAAGLKSMLGMGKTALGLAGNLSNLAGWQQGADFFGNTKAGVGVVNDALGVYSGLEQGGAKGYLSALKSGTKLANLAGFDTGSFGKGLGVLGAAYGAKNTLDIMKTGNVKNSALSGMSTGASIGSLIPGVGTILGAGIGALVGSAGALIQGKDNPEEQVADAYYSNRAKGNIKLGAVDDKAFTEALVGEFRRSRSSFPARLAGYGPKDDDKWAADLATKINSAYSAGTISKTDDAFSIYDKVVDPWFKSQGGWGNWLSKENVQNMQTMALDTVHRYISGRPITWQDARGGRSEFAVPKYLGLGGSSGRPSGMPWDSGMLTNQVIKPSGNWFIPETAGRPI